MRDIGGNILIKILIIVGIILIGSLIFLSNKKEINFTINSQNKFKTIKLDDKNKLEISIKDKLIIKINNEEINITGIDDIVDKYSYNNNLLLLSSKENNYIAKIDISNTQEIQFKKIDNKYDIDKISTCGNDVALQLTNNEKRTIKIEDDIIIGEYDCNKYIEKIGKMYLDSNQKIYNEKEQIKFKNKELIIDRIYLTEKNNEDVYYVIAYNNLYMIKDNEVKLIGTDLIYNKSKQGLNNYNDITEEIVYTDDSKSIISNIKTIYEY